MVQEATSRPLTREVLVQAQADTCAICVSVNTEISFSQSLGSALSVSFHKRSTIITSCIIKAIKLYHLKGALNGINKRLRSCIC